MNGLHDAANSIATVVSTGVLRPHHAVAFAAFFNFVAIFVFHLKVAATVGKGIVDPAVIDHYVVFGALVGAISWNAHHLVLRAAVVVVARAHRRAHRRGGGEGRASRSLVASGIGKTVLFIFVSPLMGFVLGGLLLVLVSWIFRRREPVAHRPMVPAPAARLGGGLQPRPRRQRRAEDDRHHLGAADRGQRGRARRSTCRCG